MSNVIQDLANNPISASTTGKFLGYTEPEETSETLPLRMYNFLLYPIRHADASREGTYFIKRLFQGPQYIWQTIHDKIFSIKDLWSITKCPDEALQYLKGIVGWTNELNYITDELDYDTLRRLIASSIPLWRKRGREETIIDLLSLLLNVRCVIWNWFDYRWIVDETEFSEHHQGYDSWIIDHGEEGLGEYESNLRIVNDGTLDKNLVKNILKLSRACGERIEITYINFLDRFLVNDDNSQWDNLEGTELTVVDSVAELDVSAEYQLSVVNVESPYEWNKYVAYFRIQGTGDDGFGIVFYYQDSDNYYGIKFKVSTYEDYELFKVVSGTYQALRIGKLAYSISENIWYGIRIHVDKDVNGIDIVKIYLDTELIIDLTGYIINEVGLFGTQNNGMIFRSIDSGSTWNIITNTDEAVIRSIGSFDNGVALAGTYNDGKILRSTNYGINWMEVENTTQLSIYSIATFSNGVAIAGSNNGKIFRSTDYGINWAETYDSVETYIYCLTTFSNGVALAGTGDNGKILRSTDYGENWSEVEDTTEASIRSISSFDTGIALAGTYSEGKIFRSIDYGANWSEVEDTSETFIHCIATFSNGVALAGTANGGKIFRSTDYGENWSEVEDTTETSIKSLATFNSGIAIAGCDVNGRLYRSTDYGENWSVVKDTDESTIHSIETLKTSTLGTLGKGTIGVFAENGSTLKISECELFQLPIELETLEINE